MLEEKKDDSNMIPPPPPPPPPVDDMSFTSNPNSLEMNSLLSGGSYYLPNNNVGSSSVFLKPPPHHPTRHEEENYIPKKRAKFGTKVDGPLNVMESLIHNIFSCGCVDPNIAVTTSSNQRKSVYASKPLGGYKTTTTIQAKLHRKDPPYHPLAVPPVMMVRVMSVITYKQRLLLCQESY